MMDLLWFRSYLYNALKAKHLGTELCWEDIRMTTGIGGMNEACEQICGLVGQGQL